MDFATITPFSLFPCASSFLSWHERCADFRFLWPSSVILTQSLLPIAILSALAFFLRVETNITI